MQSGIGTNGTASVVTARPSTLAEMVRSLAALRRAWARLEELAAEANQRAMQTPEWQAFQDLTGQMADMRQEMDALDEAIRRDAIAAYDADMTRRPVDGVEVKLYRKLRYNPGVAEMWVRENCPAALVFDTKRFERIAEQLDGAPVTAIQEPRATIARDLSGWLEA